MFGVQPLRVLIADDHRSTADSLAVLLQVWGHDVRVAYDGQAAINVAADFVPQVALLDFQMPKMHGGEVAQWLRYRPEFRAIRIFAISGNPPDDPRLAEWWQYFDAALGKPVNLTKLEEALAHEIRCEL